MRLPRRIFCLALGFMSFMIVSPPSWAQTYPVRPVHIFVGFPAGGTSDIVARMVAQCLSDRFGQQFIVENRPGANTNMAAEMLAHAAPDGYTIGLVGISNALNATLYTKLNFDLKNDLTMVAGLSRSPLVLEVHPSIPVNTVSEFISYAKANPGKLTMASYGYGSISHLAGELFKAGTGIDILHVPYRGSAPLVVDLISGQVQSAFDNLPASIEHIRGGRLRALAVTALSRSQSLPDIPSLGDFLPGYEVGVFFGVGAPNKTPPDIVAELNRAINACLADPNIRARLADLGGEPLVLSSVEFARLIADETNKWSRVIQNANIKLE